MFSQPNSLGKSENSDTGFDYNITRQHRRRALSGARGGEPPRAPSRVHDVGELEDERVAPVREGRPVAPLQYPSVRAVPAAAKRWPHLEHYWLDERAIRDLGVGRVPSRLVVDGGARVRRRWDGTHGRVLQGRHGASLANGSHTLVLELADVVHS